MDPSMFDRVSQLFATKAARRGALAGAAGAAALVVMPEAEAKPAKGRPGASKKKGRKPKQEEKTSFLFLQTATGGTLSDNGDGTFDLVLEGHHGGTVYFSDRPQRVFGVSPTEQFLDGLGFSRTDPPNAALLVNAGDAQDVAIVELLDPVFDEATGRLTYTIRILADYPGGGLDFLAGQAGDDRLPAAFGGASLFIDDCPDRGCCCNDDLYTCLPVPANSGPTGTCWGWLGCEECQSGEFERLDKACVDAFGPGFVSSIC